MQEHFSDLHEYLGRITVNTPYIAVVYLNSKIEFYIVAERIVISKVSNLYKAIYGLIATFFIYDMSYPTPMRHVLLFIQHIILKLVDKEKLTPIVLKVHSSITST